HAVSLKKIKEEIADRAGVKESDVAERLSQAYSATDTALYDRLGTLFRAMDRGDPDLNVPAHSGGLFNTTFLPSPSGGEVGGGGGGAGGEGIKPHHTALPPAFLEFARKLRKERTDAEGLLWSLLRGRRLAGWKFRRQHPIEPYVLDFYCHEARLAVELD